jgi:hypothetical protein
MKFSTLTFQLRYVYLGIAAFFFAFYVIFIRQYEIFTKLQVVYATCIVFLGMLPGLVMLINKREAELIPLMPMHGIFYAFTFGLPIIFNRVILPEPILSENLSQKFNWEMNKSYYISMALAFTIIGQLCLYIGYYGFGKIFGNCKPIRFRNIPPQQQLRFAWFLFGCYCLLQLFPALKNLPTVNQLSTPLTYMSLGILSLLALDNKLSRLQSIFFSIAIAYTAINLFLLGSLYPIVMLIIFFGVLVFANKNRIPWALIILIVFLVFMFNPLKQKYREYTWQSPNAFSLVEKSVIFGDVFEEHYKNKNILEEIAEDKSVIHRVANIGLFSYVIALTPDYIPFWFGESYRTLWTSFIPRFLWPGKPQATIGQDFGHRYLLLQVYDKGTSINLPWLIEFYINFGILGVLSGMFFVGIFFRLLLIKLNVPIKARMEYVLAVTITFSLFYAESNFSLMVGGMLPTFILFIIFIRLLNTGSFVTSSGDVHRLK